MVWGLFPVDPLPGEDTYYIFKIGTYKIGRKGCDVIINKDKGVSRIHAEILVDEMVSLDNQKKLSSISSKVRIKDCSKYGTFVNNTTGLKEKVHEFPNKETLLKDGDLISFGTGNATYKFCYVSLIFLVYSKKLLDQFLQDKISSIGASIIRKWNPKCTHVILEDLIPLKEDILDPLLAKKPFVRLNWVELIAGKSICTEIPSCISYAPSLTMEDNASIRIVDPQSREHCLNGYTFLLESIRKYKFRDRFMALLEIGGAKVAFLETFSSNTQGVEEEENNRVVRVIPTGPTNISEGANNTKSLLTVKEAELISAVINGHLDPSLILSPPVLITSSCSTDETVVADSDTELETATSLRTTNLIESDTNIIIDTHVIESEEETEILMVPLTESQGKNEVQEVIVPQNWSDTAHITVSSEIENSIKTETGNIDIIYSQDLIVRDITNFPLSSHNTTKSSGVNFKGFRKKGVVQSGNSFSSLIPFAKYPYKESENGNEEVVESIKEEKKRKQREAVAEDLFNNEKARKRGAAGRGTAGTISELLA